MKIEKMRAEFEAWYGCSCEWHGSDVEHDGNEYIDGNVQLAFDAWQASRAALVVELPGDDGMDGHLWAPDVVAAIEAAGVTVK